MVSRNGLFIAVCGLLTLCFSIATISGIPTDSGYTDETAHSHSQKQVINTEQAQELLPAALASQLAHAYKLSERSDQQRLDYQLNQAGLTPFRQEDVPTSLLEDFHSNISQRFLHADGLQARAFYHGNTVILAFAGTDFDLGQRSLTTLYTSFWLIQGSSMPVLSHAGRVCRELKQQPGVKEIIVTGNSLGGAIAQYAGISCGARVIAFNSLYLAESLRLQAVQERVETLQPNIPSAAAGKIYQSAGRNLTLAEVEGESLNNSYLSAVIQGSHPQEARVLVIPPYNRNLSYLSRHWAPTAVKSLQTLIKKQHQPDPAASGL